MAIVLEDRLGWILDEEKWYNACYEKLGLRINSSLYEIEEPFRMDSQVEAMNRRRQQAASVDIDNEQKSTDVEKADAKNRKRRHRSINRNGKVDDDEFVSALRRDFEILINAGHFLQNSKIDSLLNNNRKAREAAKCAEMRANFPDIAEQDLKLEDQRTNLALSHGSAYNADTLASKICLNENENPIVIRLDNIENRYLMPANCRFSWGDVGRELHFLSEAKIHQFDLIILDPPWRNKSVKRQKTYSSKDEIDLEDLPIKNLLKPGGLTAIWITNNPQYFNFVIDQLLPRWGLVYEARWFWLKVTKFGVPVCEYRQRFKMPFESIVFARRPNSGKGEIEKLPERKLLISVPSALPSRKPPLIDLMKRCLGEESLSCLELFARYLVPDTFSIGDQVIKFQCDAYFENTFRRE